MKKHSVNGKRANWRFPLDLKLSYSVRESPTVRGCGTTVDISSSGVLFQADGDLQVHDKMELIIHWPALLDGTAPLNLVVWGMIIRHDTRGYAMIVQASEFRTRGRDASFRAIAAHTSMPEVFAAHRKIPAGDETIHMRSSL